MAVTREIIEQAIASYNDPYLGQNLVESKALKDVRIDDVNVEVDIELGYPAEDLKNGLQQILQIAVGNIDGVASANVNVSWKVTSHQTQNNMKSMDGVKNIIAVASGKGGVGKSTVAVNLALALSAGGAKVGIQDVDIYGPSLAMMLGVSDDVKPETRDNKYFLPIKAHGLKTMSMAYLATEDTPMVWRGPMVTGAMQQMLNQTLWNDEGEELDFLIIDMPPGTGDIQLTLSQKVPVTGSVIVTTPQDIALLDARKGIEMFRKVGIPVLGVVENMSTHTCSNCGHVEHPFGEGGGVKIAERYETELLGALPLSLSVRELMDKGTPVIVADPEGSVTLVFKDIARKMAAALSLKAKNYANAFPNIVVEND